MAPSPILLQQGTARCRPLLRRHALSTNGSPSAPKNVSKIDYPIGDWLQYCDRQPGRSGEIFNALRHKFDAESYRRINQLTGDRITVENLSNWLGIGKGTANLIIQYTEDVALLQNGEFKMDSYEIDDYFVQYNDFD